MRSRNEIDVALSHLAKPEKLQCRPDIFLANVGTRDQLFFNAGDGEFVESERGPAAAAGDSYGVLVSDLNNGRPAFNRCNELCN